MKIFISYAKPDKDFALSLTEQLTRQGHQVWTADLALFPGDNWPLAIGKALEECGAMVVLLSPNSGRSESQRHEIEFALTSDRYAGRVIPVFIRPTKNYPWILERFSPVNADNNPAGVGRKIGQLLRKVS
jgi:TIR domain